MRLDFLLRLEAIRRKFGSPMILSSAYRCPRHNTEVSSTGLTGPHTTGRAVDVLAYGDAALTLIRFALEENVKGLGVSQRGPRASRFVHLDDLEPPDHSPRPWVWSY